MLLLLQLSSSRRCCYNKRIDRVCVCVCASFWRLPFLWVAFLQFKLLDSYFFSFVFWVQIEHKLHTELKMISHTHQAIIKMIIIAYPGTWICHIIFSASRWCCCFFLIENLSNFSVCTKKPNEKWRKTMLKTHSQTHSSNVEIQMVDCEIRSNLTPKICFIFYHTISTYRDDKQKPIGFATRNDSLLILRQIHRTFYVKSHKIPIFYNILKVLVFPWSFYYDRVQFS